MFPISSRIKSLEPFESPSLSYMSESYISEKSFANFIKYLININCGIKTMYDNKEITNDELNFAANCFLELGNMLKRMVNDGKT